MTMSKKLKQAAEAAKAKAQEGFTFNFNNVEIKVSSTGNTGFRVKLDNDTIVTFWESNMDDVIEEIDDKGTCRVIQGTRITKEGSLISANAESGGFWK